MRTLGTAACPPYHIAFVIGGTSAETDLKTVKLASAKYYDELRQRRNEARSGVPRCGTGEELLIEAQNLGRVRSLVVNTSLADIRVIRLPRLAHPAGRYGRLLFC